VPTLRQRRGVSSTGRRSQKKEQEVATLAASLHQRVTDPEAKQLIGRFIEAHADMGRKYREGFEAFKRVDFAPDKGDAAVKGIDRAPTQLLDEAAKEIAQQASTLRAGAIGNGKTAMASGLGVIALTSLLGLAVGRLVSRSVIRLLGGEPADATEVARAIAGGDLTREFQIRQGDERSLMAALAHMQKSLAQLVSGVRENAEAVAAASSRIAQGNSDLSSRTEEQAGATMEEIVTAVRRVADITVEISAASREQGSGVSQVGTAVVQIDQATQQNAALVEEAATATASLKTQAERLLQGVSSFRLRPALQ
jgi:methyl-accepting chemotaxis protein-1 (serine sensor receptor)